MYLISVTPFVKSIKADSLTYFYSKPINPGNIVTISIRNKDVKGLVLKSEAVSNSKQELRNASYQIKKIKGVSKKPLVSDTFIKASERLADYFATSIGSVISSLIPNLILENYNDFQFQTDGRKLNANENLRDDIKKFIIQNQDEERYSEYKSLIRTEFAKNKSVLICVSTIEDVENTYTILSKGIDKHIFKFHSKINKNKIKLAWQEISESKKPNLIIVTGKFLCVPQKNISTIIIERENSAAFKNLKQPYIDYRLFAEYLSEESRADLIIADFLLRAKTLWRYDKKELKAYSPIKFKAVNNTKNKIIDMNAERVLISKDQKKYPILSLEIQDLLEKAQKENNRTVIITSRKGLSPITICGDCGEIVSCEKCDSPMVLYGKSNQKKYNYFVCHHCGNTKSALVTCSGCGSWKLNMLGIGVETIQKELEKILPTKNIYILDKNRANTINKSRKIIDDFLNNPAGILVGTEIILLYLKEEVENVVIANIDSMFTIPDFQIKERMLNIVLRSKNKASKNFYIQSKDPENLIFKSALKNDSSEFYRQEFMERKKFNYPPFSILVKITKKDSNKIKLTKEFENLQKFFLPFDLIRYSNLIKKENKFFSINGIIKIKDQVQVPDDLKYKLKSLPPNFQIEIDTQNII